MRTTLTIDDRVLAVARARARVRGSSVGEAVSELAMIGYQTESTSRPAPTGFPMLPDVDGHVITVAMVDAALEDD